MDSLLIEPHQTLAGELSVPGDKSITHRALIFAALATGESTIENPLDCADTQSTVRVLRQLGVEIDCSKPHLWHVKSRGLHGFTQPEGDLDAGNSGTTCRLLMGILAAQKFPTRIIGDASLSRRPMERVMLPLQRMGAKFKATDGHLPIEVAAAPKDGLTGLRYISPVASAQVKSACLLAALYARGVTSITEPSMSRDHTERLLRQYMPVSANLVDTDKASSPKKSATRNYVVEIAGPVQKWGSRPFKVPGDFSSAAFFLVGGCIVPGAKVKLRNVGINPTRTGLWDILKEMKAHLTLDNEEEIDSEPVGNLRSEESQLAAINVFGARVPLAIDEVPIWSVAAALVSKAGTFSVLSDASELRVKESDRLEAMAENLKRLGVHVESKTDGLVIRSCGPKFQHPKHSGYGPGYLESFSDHRIAMAMIVASLCVKGKEPTEIRGADCIEISYPQFHRDFKKLLRKHS